MQSSTIQDKEITKQQEKHSQHKKQRTNSRTRTERYNKSHPNYKHNQIFHNIQIALENTITNFEKKPS